MEMGKRFGSFLLVSSIILGILTGCKKIDPTFQSEEDLHSALVERVHEFNTARVQGNLQVLHGMHWSGYREVVDLPSFVSQPRNVTIQAYVLEDQPVIDDNLAIVVVLTDFTAMTLQFKGRREVQKWILEHGDWFFHKEPPEPGVISTPFGPYRPRNVPAD